MTLSGPASAKRLRILQVTPSLAPSMGGVAQVVQQASRRLAANGHAVTILTSRTGGAANIVENDSVRVVAFPAVLAQTGFPVSAGMIRWVRAHLGDFDVIHLHTMRTFANATVRGEAARIGRPLVMSAHGTLPVFGGKAFAKRVYDVVCGRQLQKDIACWIAVSAREAGQYYKAGIVEEKVREIPNGLDLNEFDSLPPKGSFRRTVPDIQPETKLILFLGRLHPVKEADLLLEAFAILAAKRTDCRLILAGPDDGDRSRLQALANRLGVARQVWFAGPIYGRDRLAALADADLVVSPAAEEIFGLAPCEALLCGTPVIVAAQSGAGDVMRAARAAREFAPRDSTSLATAIGEALADGKENERQVRAGQKFIRQHLSWEVVVEDWESVYRSVIAERGETREGAL